MTGQPLPAELAARLFRALYADYDLLTVGGMYVVIPRGAFCLTGPAWGR